MPRWLSVTVEWRAVCVERRTYGSERRGGETARLRPASYSTPAPAGFSLPHSGKQPASRYVLSWEISNTLDAAFCVSALQSALARGKPEVFNSDQGAQYTSEKFTSVLLARKIRISMDGRGRAYDNIFIERLWRSLKYEEVYLSDYGNVTEAVDGIKEVVYVL